MFIYLFNFKIFELTVVVLNWFPRRRRSWLMIPSVTGSQHLFWIFAKLIFWGLKMCESSQNLTSDIHYRVKKAHKWILTSILKN